ncbi:MAG: hypothetical protein INF12_14535 [Methylobacterium sp.]|nr:hypothetical protein [Methylobacterium sp.]
MIPVLAVLYSLAGPLFWRDAVADCEAAIEQLNADVAAYAPETPLMLVHWDCDEDKRADGLQRPYYRLTTASGKPPAINIFFLSPGEDE